MRKPFNRALLCRVHLQDLKKHALGAGIVLLGHEGHSQEHVGSSVKPVFPNELPGECVHLVISRQQIVGESESHGILLTQMSSLDRLERGPILEYRVILAQGELAGREHLPILYLAWAQFHSPQGICVRLRWLGMRQVVPARHKIDLGSDFVTNSSSAQRNQDQQHTIQGEPAPR